MSLGDQNQPPWVDDGERACNWQGAGLYPVILAVPETGQDLPPRERTAFLSAHARRAVRRSAQRAGWTLNQLRKNDRGVPLPSDGIYWSLSHKPKYVAAVVASYPIGIDVEVIRPVHPGMNQKVASEAEWSRIPEERLERFFRVWTAKEAVLKAVGIGIRGLKACEVVSVIGRTQLLVDYQQTRWLVVQHWFNGHLAAVTTRDCQPHWIVEPRYNGG